MGNIIQLEDIAAALNNISWDILSMLSKTESLSYSEIKKKLNVSQDKASKEIARLEGGLLIKSKRDDIDSRLLKFSLTDNGLDIIKYRK